LAATAEPVALGTASSIRGNNSKGRFIMTPAQSIILKADMLGASNLSLSAWIAGNDWQRVADFYNGDSTTNVWRPDAPVDPIKGAILWANLTPTDAPDGTTSWTNRALCCQGKQFNLQLMLGQQSNATVPGDLAPFRAGMQDALTNIPSGVAGAVMGGGWATVQGLLRRFGTRYEVLFSVVDGNANKSSVYGQRLSSNDCYLAYLQV
jgi:hypothetical protein